MRIFCIVPEESLYLRKAKKTLLDAQIKFSSIGTRQHLIFEMGVEERTKKVNGARTVSIQGAFLLSAIVRLTLYAYGAAHHNRTSSNFDSCWHQIDSQQPL